MPIWTNPMDQMKKKSSKRFARLGEHQTQAYLPQGYPISFPNASWKTGPFRRVWMPLK